MSEQTLDRVARALATGMPRRAVMKAAAAAAGGVLSMIGRHEEALAGKCSRDFGIAATVAPIPSTRPKTITVREAWVRCIYFATK